MKKAVMQNASVNIYENYFDGDCANVLQCYRHPNEQVVVRLTLFETTVSCNIMNCSVQRLKFPFPLSKVLKWL